MFFLFFLIMFVLFVSLCVDVLVCSCVRVFVCSCVRVLVCWCVGVLCCVSLRRGVFVPSCLRCFLASVCSFARVFVVIVVFACDCV